MFDESEINNYVKEFEQLGILDKTQQKEVLEYFFQLGKIIYKFNISSYGKEN